MSRAQGVASILIPLLVAACAGLTRGGATEVVAVSGAGTGTWMESADPPPLDFHWKYETVAWSGGSPSPFHRMMTELDLSYDPASGDVRAAKLTSSGRARSSRTITVTPAGALLKIQVATLLSPSAKDRTVLRIGAPSDVGVGPAAGLVEAIRVKFTGPGSYEVLPDTGAHLAGANVHVDRRMTCGPAATESVTASFP